MKLQKLIREGLRRRVCVINRLLERLDGIGKIIEQRDEDDPMARMVLIVNEACMLFATDTAEAYLERSFNAPTP